MQEGAKQPIGKKPKNCYARPNSPYWYCSLRVRGISFDGSTGCRTAKQAEEWVAAKRAELGREADVRDGKAPPLLSNDISAITLGDAVEKYENDKACRMSSFKDMQRMGENLCVELGVDTWLHTLTHRDMQRYYETRRGTTSARHKPLSGASVNREISYMRQVWKHAKRNSFLVGIEPEWGEIIDMTAETVRIRELKPNEEERLFRALLDLHPDMAGLVEFALLSGQRKSACTGLKRTEVNLVDREATFVLKTKGQLKRRHTIPLTDRMVEIIEEQPEVEGVEEVFTYVCDRGGRKAEGVYRVVGQRYAYTKWGWRDRWAAILERAKVADFRFHDLRHTTATRILRETNNLVIAQRLLGHTDIATTKRYAHANLDDVREGLNTVAGAVARKREERAELELVEAVNAGDNVVAVDFSRKRAS